MRECQHKDQLRDLEKFKTILRQCDPPSTTSTFPPQAQAKKRDPKESTETLVAGDANISIRTTAQVHSTKTPAKSTNKTENLIHFEDTPVLVDIEARHERPNLYRVAVDPEFLDVSLSSDDEQDGAKALPTKETKKQKGTNSKGDWFDKLRPRKDLKQPIKYQ